MKFNLILLLLFISSFAAAQFKVQNNSIGFIMQATSDINNSIIPIGSASVVIENSLVITAAHVVNDSGVYFYQPVGSGNLFPLVLLKTDTLKDLALLKSRMPVCDSPFQIHKNLKLKKGDPIIYIGWDPPSNKYIVSATMIKDIGRSTKNHLNTETICALGEAKEGYSGGPILTVRGEIIGLLSYGTPIENTEYSNLKGKFTNYFCGVSILDFLDELIKSPR